jgi:hypothetical protein
MDSTLRLLRKRSASDVYVWRMHEPAKDDPPLARVLSLRATDGYFARSEPKIGNRLVIHALVKFDTKQVRKSMLHIAESPFSTLYPTELANILQTWRSFAHPGTEASSGVSRTGETDVVRYALDDSRAAVRESWRAHINSMIGDRIHS